MEDVCWSYSAIFVRLSNSSGFIHLIALMWYIFTCFENILWNPCYLTMGCKKHNILTQNRWKIKKKAYAIKFSNIYISKTSSLTPYLFCFYCSNINIRKSWKPGYISTEQMTGTFIRSCQKWKVHIVMINAMKNGEICF